MSLSSSARPGSRCSRIVLLIFQYLIGELLKSKHRGEQLHRIATTDELTGLANREWFRARLDERIAAARVGERFGVMLLDLDRFKEINDTLGHHFGDEMLRDLGPRLGAAIGPTGSWRGSAATSSRSSRGEHGRPR